jgi:hypothetical protein
MVLQTRGTVDLAPKGNGSASGRVIAGTLTAGFKSFWGRWYGGLAYKIPATSLVLGGGNASGLARVGAMVRVELVGDDESSGLVRFGTTPLITPLGGGASTGRSTMSQPAKITPKGGGAASSSLTFAVPLFMTPLASAASSGRVSGGAMVRVELNTADGSSGLVAFTLPVTFLPARGGGAASGMVTVKAPGVRITPLASTVCSSILTFADIKLLTGLASTVATGLVSFSPISVAFIKPLGGGSASGKVMFDGIYVNPGNDGSPVDLISMSPKYALRVMTANFDIISVPNWTIRRIR